MDTRAILDSTELPRHEVERLIMVVTGAPRFDVVGGVTIDAESVNRLGDLVARRQGGEPLQYLEGTAAFGPIEVAVDPRVLIPRPETEQLWERLMAFLPDDGVIVVDVCTGSGCIALATKHQRHDLSVIGTDISGDALDVARGNARSLGLDVSFREGDLLSALDPSLHGAVGAIVSNPPYVARSEWNRLPIDVRDHEPELALVAGEDGLAVYRRMAVEAGQWLTEDGAVLMEIGEHQGEAVVRLFRAEGWATQLDVDLAGRDRFLTARRRASIVMT